MASTYINYTSGNYFTILKEREREAMTTKLEANEDHETFETLTLTSGLYLPVGYIYETQIYVIHRWCWFWIQ
jgi:hypothetical protein